MDDKLYVFIGRENSNDQLVILESWSKQPTQDTIDALVKKYYDRYKKFALMTDMLFIEGNQNPRRWDFYDGI